MGTLKWRKFVTLDPPQNNLNDFQAILRGILELSSVVCFAETSLCSKSARSGGESVKIVGMKIEKY